jgi:hypothetical protein
MKFRYSGSNPLPAFFGFDWTEGSEHDVTDAHAIRKLGNNAMFAAADGAVSFAEDAGTKEIAERFAPADANVTPIRKPRAKKASA